jgi:hypothetical protein
MILALQDSQYFSSMSEVLGKADVNPMCTWMMMSEHRAASMSGLREPAAKGAMVRGIKPAEMSLIYMLDMSQSSTHRHLLPLKGPVIVAMARGGFRNRRGVIDIAFDRLRKRRQNRSATRGVESGGLRNS